LSSNNRMINESLKNSWSRFSLMEQLGNIASEVGRAANWQGKDEKRFDIAVDKALELIGLTQRDPRWKGRLRELAIAKEVFGDAVTGGQEYKSTLPDIEKYFMQFAVLARK